MKQKVSFSIILLLVKILFKAKNPAFKKKQDFLFMKLLPSI